MRTDQDLLRNKQLKKYRDIVAMQRGKSTSELFEHEEIYQPKKFNMQTLSHPNLKHINDAKELVALKASQLPSYLTKQQNNHQINEDGNVLSSLKLDLEKLT